MPPKPSLSASVAKTTTADAERIQEAVSATPAQRVPKARPRSPSRAGMGMLGGYYPEDVRIAWKTLAASQGKTIQSLLAEAMNDLFEKNGKPRIVDPTRLR